MAGDKRPDGYEGFALEVAVPAPAFGAARARYLDGTRCIVASERGETAVAHEVGSPGSATSLSARFNCGGNSLPRLTARRRMPRQAVALNQYRCGTSPPSKTADNEDATAALWNSEVLSVKNSVSEPIPALAQEPEKGSKRPSPVNRQDAGHVLPDHPLGAKPPSKRSKLEREVATRIIHAPSQSSDGEALAGVPPTRTSTGPASAPIFVKSPWFRTSG